MSIHLWIVWVYFLQQSGVVEAETNIPVKRKTFTVWPFKKTICQLLEFNLLSVNIEVFSNVEPV